MLLSAFLKLTVWHYTKLCIFCLIFLGIEDLERDLISSLNEYELVNDQTDKTDEQWEEEIAQLLDSA